MELWLDDERDPHDPYVQEYFNSTSDMLWVKTADAAISRLKQGTVQFISLDHDLGTTSTGYDVAKWIEERAFHGELTRINWAIHSANAVGAKAIRRAMLNADRYWSEREAE